MCVHVRSFALLLVGFTGSSFSIPAGRDLWAFWYLLAVERKNSCWEQACIKEKKCEIEYLYCGYEESESYKAWMSVSKDILDEHCVESEAYGEFDYGIYLAAVQSQVDSSEQFISKYFYCLWWGLRNLRYKLNLLLTYNNALVMIMGANGSSRA
ncbi:hypothetical protein HanHA300_Chr00c0099g0709591 [Helianthus annuus]|nr:hypothetical protein HanHA300_Chr00c0099g0709591 [Helianthus annuus]